jgi:hypothetical protein
MLITATSWNKEGAEVLCFLDGKIYFVESNTLVFVTPNVVEDSLI